MKRWKIVYFDDDMDQIELLSDMLSARLKVSGTNDISQVDTFIQSNPDLILIDVHMPQISGFELYYKILYSPHYNGCPMMFISGDDSTENRLKSFNLGAGDFLPRDLEESEIAARLINKIKLFRKTALKITVDNLTLDLENFNVFINDKLTPITLNELKVLGVILRNFPKVCSRNAIISKIWGEDSIKPGTVNAHVSSLNSKLKEWTYEIKFKREDVLLVPKEC